MTTSNSQPTYLYSPQLLGSLTADQFREMKRRVVAANRAIGYWYQQKGDDVLRMHVGHVSARIPGTNTFIGKGRPPERDFMAEVTKETLVQVDIPSRKKVSGEIEVSTMGEIELHAVVYEKRPDVVAVAHVNGSDWIQLCAVFGLKLKAFGIEGMELVDHYGVYDKPYMLSANETAVPMVEALGKNNVVLCAGHGCVSVSSKGPEDAAMTIFKLDQLCKMNWLAFTAIGPEYTKHAISEDVTKSHFELMEEMMDRTATPGKDLTVDVINACAALARTIRDTSR